MRSLVLIAGVVGVLLYGAAVSQKGLPAFAAPHATPVQAPSQGLGALVKGLEATGAGLDEATLAGWGEVREPGARDRVATALGAVPGEGESRTIEVRDRDGRSYVTVLWKLTGKAASRWAASFGVLQKVLQQSTHAPSVTVQLGGTTADFGNLTDLTARALDSLRATDRQPWSDPRAASVAGRTTHLPPGPFGVNVQVAVRTDPAKGTTRVWVAWPALMQEY